MVVCDNYIYMHPYMHIIVLCSYVYMHAYFYDKANDIFSRAVKGSLLNS